MTVSIDQHFKVVIKNLEQYGMLLVSGIEIFDVRRLVSGESGKGSWWSDKAAHTIFAINELLEDHPDVTITKLISRKVTFVHRQLWSQLYAIGAAKSEWQTDGLTKPAEKLLQEIEVEGVVATNKLPRTSNPSELAKELELRLLVHARQVHTESGAHAKILESWSHWATTVKFKPKSIDTARAQTFLETRLEEINKACDGTGNLPWLKPQRRRAK
jgi:hypothetical protein